VDQCPERPEAEVYSSIDILLRDGSDRVERQGNDVNHSAEEEKPDFHLLVDAEEQDKKRNEAVIGAVRNGKITHLSNASTRPNAPLQSQWECRRLQT